jgi:hypothetical protein
MRFEGYEHEGVVYSFCPACGRWDTNPHGLVELVGPAPPEVRADMKRIRPRGPHYHRRNRLGHALANARVTTVNGEVSIDLRTTPFHFTGDGLTAFRAVAQEYGRSVLETPQRVAAERIEDVDSFFRAVGKSIEKWIARESCKHALP